MTRCRTQLRTVDFETPGSCQLVMVDSGQGARCSGRTEMPTMSV